MTQEELLRFDRLMKSYYHNRCIELDGTNSVLWNHIIDLIRALADAESDGSSIASLKALGSLKANELRAMLERKQAPHANAS